jgi:hypothetical protein
MKNLIFFNYFHNGDIHVSREFVKDILNKTNFNNHIYYHHNSKKKKMYQKDFKNFLIYLKL